MVSLLFTFLKCLRDTHVLLPPSVTSEGAGAPAREVPTVRTFRHLAHRMWVKDDSLRGKHTISGSFLGDAIFIIYLFSSNCTGTNKELTCL